MTLLGLLILAPAAVAVPVPEYSGPRPRGLVLVPYVLLQKPGVQKELKLTREQEEKLAVLAEEYRQAVRDTSPSPDEALQQRRAAAAAHQKGLARILTRRQLGRAEQIALQLFGPMTFIRPQVAGALGLSAEQREKVKAIWAEFRGHTRDRLQLNLCKEKMMDVLTPTQKEKWKILTGPPYAEERGLSPP